MIIECICGEKKFEVSSELIPASGRTIKCGSCDKIWFYKPENLENENQKDLIIENELPINSSKSFKKKQSPNPIIDQSYSEIDDKKNYEITKYKPKKSLSFLNFFSYLIVLLISFIAILIVIDTFNTFLYQFFPGLELIMFNLFETLKDIELFIRDLI